MSFPENLKRIRLEKGMSQQALAKAAGVSQTAIYHWEKGLRVPKIGSLDRIADALDVTVDDFFIEIVDGKPIVDMDLPGLSEDEIHDYLAYMFPERVYISMEAARPYIINKLLDSLNDLGQDKAIEQVELLTKIPEYQKESQQEESPSSQTPSDTPDEPPQD